MKKAIISAGIVLASVLFVSAQVSGTINFGSNPGGGYGGVYANQGQVNGGALLSLLALAQTIVARLGIFAVGLAVLAFFWFLIEFIWQGRNDPSKRTASLQGMGYSILALFVMVSIWGIIGLLGSITGVSQGGTVPIPGIPVPASNPPLN
jgi:hypothetical protein